MHPLDMFEFAEFLPTTTESEPDAKSPEQTEQTEQTEPVSDESTGERECESESESESESDDDSIGRNEWNDWNNRQAVYDAAEAEKRQARFYLKSAVRLGSALLVGLAVLMHGVMVSSSVGNIGARCH